MPKIKTLVKWYRKGGVSEIWRQYHEGILLRPPKAWFKTPESITIDRPIFFVGVQSGGMTIISRMLRRHKDSVCVTGNYRYWTGGDEMAPRYPNHLPEKLTARFYFYEKYLGEGVKGRTFNQQQLAKLPETYKTLYQRYGLFWWWNYACDDLFPFFYADERDYDDETAREFKGFLKRIIFVNAISVETARIVDKSQAFSPKIGLIDRILRESHPYFIMVIRNPYAVCYKAASQGYLTTLPLSFGERLHVASQHYKNTFCTILDSFNKILDQRKIIVKLEDFLLEPKEHLKIICEKVGLEFDEDMLPQPHHKYPLGTPDRTKWYPLKKDVNAKYLKKLGEEDSQIVRLYCKDLIERFSYKYL